MCCILWHYILSPVLCSFVLHFMLCIVLYCIVLSCPLLCQRCVKPSLTVFNWHVTRTLKWPWRSRVQIMCNTSGAYHVQHIGRLSRATHRALITCNTSGVYHVQHAVCHVVQRDSSGCYIWQCVNCICFRFMSLAEIINRLQGDVKHD